MVPSFSLLFINSTVGCILKSLQMMGHSQLAQCSHWLNKTIFPRPGQIASPFSKLVGWSISQSSCITANSKGNRCLTKHVWTLPSCFYGSRIQLTHLQHEWDSRFVPTSKGVLICWTILSIYLQFWFYSKTKS